MRLGKRLNKYEKKENRERKLRMDMAGTGVYVYENNTDGDLTLPKPTATGLRRVGPRQRFQGDSYYMAWVKPPLNLLRFIEAVRVAEPQQAITENTDMAEKKLILDQPDTITHKGKVEHLVEDPGLPQKLHDSNDPNKKQQDVLLTEDPLDGVEIILG
jgi:hypothetical protein